MAAGLRIACAKLSKTAQDSKILIRFWPTLNSTWLTGANSQRHSSSCTKTTVCTDVHAGSRVRIKTYDCSPSIGPLDYHEQTQQGAHGGTDCMIIKHCENCSVRIDLRAGEPKNFRPIGHYSVPAELNANQQDQDEVAGERERTWELVRIEPHKSIDTTKTVRCTIHNEPHAELCGCHIQLPARVHLDLQCDGDADLKVSRLEFTRCRITCAGGMSTLRKIRCSHLLELYCKGPITIDDYCEGNAVIQTVSERSFIRANGRLAGDKLVISAESGPIQCNSVYAKELNVFTTRRGGNIDMKNVHGDVKVVAEAGNVHIASHEGENLSVQSKRGDIKIDLVKSGTAILEAVDGAIVIGVPSSDDAVYLNLRSNAGVKLDPEWSAVAAGDRDNSDVLEWQGLVGASSHRRRPAAQEAGGVSAAVKIHAVAKNGAIQVKQASWFGNLFQIKSFGNRPS